MKNITEAELELYFWQMSKAGSFTTALFECIGKADIFNRAKLYTAFPDEVDVYKRYESVPGYWANLKDRIEGK